MSKFLSNEISKGIIIESISIILIESVFTFIIGMLLSILIESFSSRKLLFKNLRIKESLI